MVPFFPFERALSSFKKTGCFWLTDEQLGPYQLIELQELFLKIPKAAEFLLSNVVIVLYEADQIAWFDYKDKQTVLTLSIQQCSLKANRINYPFFQARQRKLEDQLLQLLVNYEWEKIILCNVFFVWRSQKVVLSTTFMSQLLAQLEKKQRKVKTLVLEGSLSVNIQPFIQYATYNDQLEVLHYEMAGPAVQDFQAWLAGGRAHSRLKKISLGHSHLDDATYQMINHFLDHHYFIEKIDIKKPKNKNLYDKWQTLMQRLALSPVERFKAEQLNQTSLLHLAEYFLSSKRRIPLGKLLGNSNENSTLSYNETNTYEVDEQWPLVYQNYRHYFKENDWAGKIGITDKVEQPSSLTVGAYLLHSMALTKEVWGTEFLLEQGANPFEKINGQSLVARLLEEKKTSQWSATILKHITQGSCTRSVCFAQKNDLWPLYLRLYALEKHLIYYFGLLHQRIHYNVLIQWFTGLFFCLKTRKEEIAEAFQVLAILVEISDPKKEMTEASLYLLQERVKQWVERAGQAKRGLRGRSVLNDGIQRLGFKLEKSIIKIRYQFFGNKIEYLPLQDKGEESAQRETNEMIPLNCFI